MKNQYRLNGTEPHPGQPGSCNHHVTAGNLVIVPQILKKSKGLFLLERSEP